MKWSPQYYIPSFVEIGPPVPEKKIFERAFTIYGRGSHLGHVTSIMSSDFHFLELESFHTKFGSDRHSSFYYKRTNGPVNAHLISWPSKAQNIQNLENIW